MQLVSKVKRIDMGAHKSVAVAVQAKAVAVWAVAVAIRIAIATQTAAVSNCTLNFNWSRVCAR